MKFYPIRELKREHQGKVVLVSVAELASGKAFGRPWDAMESSNPYGHGTDDPAELQSVFTHFLVLAEIEAEERRDLIQRQGWPLTAAEERRFDEKYGRAQEEG